MLLCNVVLIDPMLGIVKGDLGVRAGCIAGFGKARQSRDRGRR